MRTYRWDALKAFWSGRVTGEIDRRALGERSLACAGAISLAYFLGDRVIGQAQVATFVGFGGVGVLIFARFAGDRRVQARSYLMLGLAGSVLIALGTVVAQPTWLAMVTMLVVGGGVMFAGAVNTSVNGAVRALLLMFIIAITIPASSSTILDRWLGWLVAVAVCAPVAVLLASGSDRRPSHAASHRTADLHGGPYGGLRGGLRGGVALAIAVGVADLVPLQHTFWIVLATMVALGPSQIGTLTSAARAALGTAIGFAVATMLTLAFGSGAATMWVVLPCAIFLAVFVPAALSYTGGQAAFTLMVIAFIDIGQPSGWTLGLVRLEDVLLGCAVAVVVAASMCGQLSDGPQLQPMGRSSARSSRRDRTPTFP